MNVDKFRGFNAFIYHFLITFLFQRKWEHGAMVKTPVLKTTPDLLNNIDLLIYVLQNIKKWFS